MGARFRNTVEGGWFRCARGGKVQESCEGADSLQANQAPATLMHGQVDWWGPAQWVHAFVNL
jgi:hypothetical protein